MTEPMATGRDSHSAFVPKCPMAPFALVRLQPIGLLIMDVGGWKRRHCVLSSTGAVLPSKLDMGRRRSLPVPLRGLKGADGLVGGITSAGKPRRPLGLASPRESIIAATSNQAMNNQMPMAVWRAGMDRIEA
jgi:hypothetical protein